MILEVDNDNFCIRLYNKVAYLKVKGLQTRESSIFFSNQIDALITNYNHQEIASLCDLSELVLDDPQNALIINNAIKKVGIHLTYKFNAVIINAKFFDIVRAFIFSYYLNNAKTKSKIFFNVNNAMKWLEKNGFQADEIKDFFK